MALLYLQLSVKETQPENSQHLVESWEALLGRKFQLAGVRLNFVLKGEPSRRQSGP